MTDKEKYLAEMIIKHKLHFSEATENGKLPISVSCLFCGKNYGNISVDDLNSMFCYLGMKTFSSHKDGCPVLVAEEILKDEGMGNV
jgi:hypothetical protein